MATYQQANAAKEHLKALLRRPGWLYTIGVIQQRDGGHHVEVGAAAVPELSLRIPRSINGVEIVVHRIDRPQLADPR